MPCGPGSRRGFPPPRRPPSTARRDDGQVSVLILGLFAIVSLLIVGGIDVTAAQIARVRILDASDAAALDAADSLDEPGAYGQGVGTAVALSDATVQRSAAQNLAARPLPTGVMSWGTAAGTGSSEGHTAVVVVQGVVRLPMTGGLLDALGGSVTVTVESRARAPLR